MALKFCLGRAMFHKKNFNNILNMPNIMNPSRLNLSFLAFHDTDDYNLFNINTRKMGGTWSFLEPLSVMTMTMINTYLDQCTNDDDIFHYVCSHQIVHHFVNSVVRLDLTFLYNMWKLYICLICHMKPKLGCKYSDLCFHGNAGKW